ncbi:interleukin-17A [Rhynchonycteris naso]
MAPLRTSSVFQSLLLLLLTLVAIVKAGIPITRHPGCPNTEDKKFRSTVRVNLNIHNRNMNSRRFSDYHNRSTSPWNLILNKDPERFPAEIWEAECRNYFCVGADGKLDHHLNSVAIQQEILVLRRYPGHCQHSFRMEKILVKVGCTCVIPIVRHVA